MDSLQDSVAGMNQNLQFAVIHFDFIFREPSPSKMSWEQAQ